MKRISFLIIVFIFTTGFFKSALEECADIQMKRETRYTKTGEYKWVDMTENEKLIAKKKWEKDKKKCETTNKCIEFYFDYNYHQSLKYPPVRKQVKIRDISKQENERAYKKFIKQSLKSKLKDRWYEDHYKNCISWKKSNPELFKAKYD